VSEYAGSGHSYLVCPQLVELDGRHAEHWSKWKPCRRGLLCKHEHEHETELVAAEPHTVLDFYWTPGCRPPTEAEHPLCQLCGQALMHVDLDDLYAAEYLAG
jgi:hypothetical protein